MTLGGVLICNAKSEKSVSFRWTCVYKLLAHGQLGKDSQPNQPHTLGTSWPMCIPSRSSLAGGINKVEISRISPFLELPCEAKYKIELSCVMLYNKAKCLLCFVCSYVSSILYYCAGKERCRQFKAKFSKIGRTGSLWK